LITGRLSKNPPQKVLLSKQRILIIIASVTLIGMVGYLLNSKLVITTTKSLRYQVFLKADGPFKLGDYVLVDGGIFGGREIALLKQHGIDSIPYIAKKIGCIEGFLLTVDSNRDYYCGTEYLGRAKEKTRKGVPLKPFIWNGTVPPGKVFLIGDNPDSFDSRYIGFVDVKHVMSRLVPLF